jgi:uncharacterized protein YbaP (TraB family)
MNEDDRGRCAICAARLEGQIQIAWLALVLTAVSILVSAITTSPLWCGVAMLGCVERYIAARLIVDARLFARLGSQSTTLKQLDEALAQLRMLAKHRSDRPLQARIEGALTWANRHTVVVASQALLTAFILATEQAQ